MKVNFDKLIKGVLVFSLLLVALSVFYYYVIFLPQKGEARLEQEHKEYVAKRKGECYDVYIQEKKDWTNVEHFSYSEVRDVCIVRYKKLDEPTKTKEECEEMIKNTSKMNDYWKEISVEYYYNCLENWFSKEF